MKKLIKFKEPLNLNLYDELSRKVYYINDKISNFKIITDEKNEMIKGIEVLIEDNSNVEEICSKILNFIEYDVRGRRYIPSKIAWRSKGQPRFNLESFAELIDSDVVVNMGEGQIALNSKIIALMDYFDDRICKIVKKKFNAIEYRYPTLIQTKTIRKCGYMKTFPQFLMVVTRLHNDFNNYKNFSDEVKCGCGCEDIEGNILKYCKSEDYCLPPTMCYYTYQQYGGKKVDSNFTVTSKGKSFRYEGKYYKTLERLWDFTIREIVFLGEYEYVVKCRKEMMEAAFALIDEVGLYGHCETASDPFFFDESANERTIFQKYLQSKYELRLNVDEERTISVASFNFHDTFFSENFDIRFNDDNLIKTGCTGFGLERLAYVFICQYGIDADNWPEKVREYYESIK